jgi:alpha-tubulin suppressor-like RCC1 family protein
MALDIEGVVYSWGCSKGGQLGHPDNFFLNIKITVEYLSV